MPIEDAFEGSLKFSMAMDRSTKRVILEIYDEMQRAMETGVPYEKRLAPPHQQAAVAHGGGRGWRRRTVVSDTTGGAEGCSLVLYLGNEKRGA